MRPRLHHPLHARSPSHFDRPEPRDDIVIRGTGITLPPLLARLAAGEPTNSILAAHPSLTADDLRAVIAFAADSAGEDMPGAALPPEFGGAMAILAKLDERVAATTPAD